MDEQRENLQPEQNEAAAQDAKKTERGWESLAFLHDMVYLLAIVTILFTFFFRLGCGGRQLDVSDACRQGLSRA